ncbi:hypothetical protein LN650_01815 [Klebsiella pneumoniae subsp. pneumoniae]|nr:hypothetical protein [Klebsiella pneumoniae subsp. pneumoniae]
MVLVGRTACITPCFIRSRGMALLIPLAFSSIAKNQHFAAEAGYSAKNVPRMMHGAELPWYLAASAAVQANKRG